jgi:hypothetical protein
MSSTSSSPNLVDLNGAKQFATLVIEVPRLSYHNHSKKSMKTVACCPLNGNTACNYTRPERLCLSRWQHIQLFYFFDLSQENYYQAQSLTHHPHYLILQSEIKEFNAALNIFLSQH